MLNCTHENTSCNVSELSSVDASDEQTPITRQLAISLGCIAIVVLILSVAGNLTVIILFARQIIISFFVSEGQDCDVKDQTSANVYRFKPYTIL
ncbi:hypothetical protein CHS0354_039212, partial [Potamilus streckersoni]